MAGVISVISAASFFKPLGERKKAVRRQELMVFLANMGGFGLGIAAALPAVTLDQLTDTENSVHFDDSQASWFASINFITCPLGALMNAYMLDKIGRQRTFMAVNLFAILSWILMATAVQDDTDSVYIQLLASRCVAGISIGLGSAPVGVYGAEISFPKYRGRLVLGTAIAVALGITFIYIVGYFIREDYHLIAKVVLCMQIGCLIALIPLVESPSWLLLVGRDVEAKKSLMYFRGLNGDEVSKELDDEFDQLQKAVHLRVGEKKPPFCKALLLPEVYKPLLIMFGMFVCQQISGIFVMIVYAVDIVIGAGINMDPILCAIILGCGRAIMIILMIWLLELWGRRICGIISALGMTIGMFALAVTSWFPFLNLAQLPVAAILLYIITSAIGLHILPFVMIAEVYPQRFRGPCAGVTGSFGFLMIFLAVKAYPSMDDEMGSANVFAFYGVMSMLSIVYIYIFLPETKGKTLLEIEQLFHGND